MLESVKAALRITVDDYDAEILDNIAAAKEELRMAGITCFSDTANPMIRRYIRTYCVANHNQPENYDKLIEALNMMMMKMKMCTGYTDWDADVPTESGLTREEDL